MMNDEPSMNNPSSSGQAMIEFVVGLVAVIVLVAAMVQIGRITRIHTEMLVKAREEAGAAAMANIYSLTLPGPQYIRDWSPGADGRRYSADDLPLLDGMDRFDSDLIAHAHPAQLEAQVADNPVSAIASSGSFVNNMAFVHGHEDETVPLLPVMQHLLYNAESMDIESDAWLIWTRGIY